VPALRERLLGIERARQTASAQATGWASFGKSRTTHAHDQLRRRKGALHVLELGGPLEVGWGTAAPPPWGWLGDGLCVYTTDAERRKRNRELLLLPDSGVPACSAQGAPVRVWHRFGVGLPLPKNGTKG